MSEKNFLYGIGKRKTSIAKILLKPGEGKITINGKTLEAYFANISDEKEALKQPLIFLNDQNKYDLIVLVKGGGTNSQLDAIKLGLSKALSSRDKETRVLLSQKLFLRRDARIKERRKYGLKKARKASQYSKR